MNKPPVNAPRCNAIGLVCQHLTQTLAFYRLAGLSIPDGAEREPHVEVDLDGFRLMFDPVSTVQSFGEWTPPAGSPRISLAFACDGPAAVDAAYRHIVEAGHRDVLAPFDAVWGQRYASVLDPEGNGVDFYAPLER